MERTVTIHAVSTVTKRTVTNFKEVLVVQTGFMVNSVIGLKTLTNEIYNVIFTFTFFPHLWIHVIEKTQTPILSYDKNCDIYNKKN